MGFHFREVSILGGTEVSTEAVVELSKTDHFSALMNLQLDFKHLGLLWLF